MQIIFPFLLAYLIIVRSRAEKKNEKESNQNDFQIWKRYVESGKIKTDSSNIYDHKACGKSLIQKRRASEVIWKVMGGSDASYVDFPWAVAIFVEDKYRCTGTLITKRHIATAGHCFMEWPIYGPGECSIYTAYNEKHILEKIFVLYGSNCINSSTHDSCIRSPKMKKAKPLKMEYLPFFESSCTKRDLALIELDQEIDETANYACLPHRARLHDHTGLRAYGWGYNPEPNITMNNLQFLEFHELLPWLECKEKMGWDIPEDVLCTEETTTQNLCTGDSGGGIVVRNSDGQWVLMGVASYGSDCTDLYTKEEVPRAQTYTNLRLYNATIDRFTGLLLPYLQPY